MLSEDKLCDACVNDAMRTACIKLKSDKGGITFIKLFNISTNNYRNVCSMWDWNAWNVRHGDFFNQLYKRYQTRFALTEAEDIIVHAICLYISDMSSRERLPFADHVIKEMNALQLAMEHVLLRDDHVREKVYRCITQQ
jgi:phosphoglycerate-specific signal transduction histidine kinase